MNEYEPSDLKSRFGIETRRTQQLCDVGIVSAESRGQGKTRKLQPVHILELLTAELLAGRGVRLARIKKIFEWARRDWPRTFDLKTYAEDEKNINSITRVLVVYEDRVWYGQMETGSNVKGRVNVQMNGFDVAVIVNLTEIYNKIKLL